MVQHTLQDEPYAADTSGRYCIAGDSIPVEVRLRLQENVEPRQARIELVGREAY
jgi:hypothetical protein